MDENADSASPFNSEPENYPETSFSRPSGSKPSGIKLVLPSLSSLKSAKTKKSTSKSHQNSSAAFYQDGGSQEKKIPRPVKLKPLKEVLAKLISQLKKKDDYAFFLRPVDPKRVQGYAEVVKRPMDLGTMAVKVNKGKYRSLEDFANDFRLVTSNAKTFNPPGTIYHTEADRLEIWGLDHISKAASTVIQYETDWNIEIEKDDDVNNIDVEDDDDHEMGTPMPTGADSRARSPSVMSQTQPGVTRRSTRGPYKKSTAPTAPTENIDAEGRLPGSKDGLGAFPPGSDWAKTMLSLKLKGKRYKTKKERLRIEKEGPPYLADGSLDYSEMEDPFSVLSVLVPDPPTRPYLAPLYAPAPATQSVYEPSRLESQTPQPPVRFPTPVNISLNPRAPILSSETNTNKPKRHWVIIRNAPTRVKGKEREDGDDTFDAPPWNTPRESHAVDFGSFAVLAGELAEEMKRRGGAAVGVEGEDEEERVFDALRESLDCESAARRSASAEAAGAVTEVASLNPAQHVYWSKQRAADAEEYIRDCVYGGVDGLAYVRSLAEFVGKDKNSPSVPNDGYSSTLGKPLAKWVEHNVVDPLTEGRHSLLRETAHQLSKQRDDLGTYSLNLKRQIDDDDAMELSSSVAAQVRTSLDVYPAATQALLALLQINTHKIDMSALIKTPEELFLSDQEWAGNTPKKPRLEAEVAQDEAMDVDGDGGSSLNGAAVEVEGPEQLSEVLKYVADVISDLSHRVESKSNLPHNDNAHKVADGAVKQEDSSPIRTTLPNHHTSGVVGGAIEDPIMRNLRLNLLALAKRAPLDTIARLPRDLVPEHIRHFIPTLGPAV